jgi:hypothetical protein
MQLESENMFRGNWATPQKWHEAFQRGTMGMIFFFLFPATWSADLPTSRNDYDISIQQARTQYNLLLIKDYDRSVL